MHRLSWIYGGPLLFLALCGSGDFGALGADLIIRNISILPGGNAQVVVAGRADSYYLLYRGEVVTDMRQPTAAEPGLAGDVTLTDPVVEPEAQAHFYRVEEVALAAPRDTDGDGMDDPFELGYRPVLNPLDPSDAASDFDGDGRTHLQEYRDRTDPMIANSPPPPATPGLAAVPDSTQGTFLTLSGNGPTNTYIRIEGGAAVATNSVSPDGTFQVNVPLSPNRLNRLLVSALNGKGEVSIGRPVEVLQDSQPPTLFLDFPGSAYAITTSNVMVAGRVGDSLSGYRGLQVWVHSAPSEGSPPLATARFPEDSPWAATVDVGIGPNGTYERGDVPLTLGTNVVTAIATDALGNRTLRRLEVVRRALEGPRLVALSGDRQITNAVRRLDQPIRVRVTQQSGTPIPDAPLLFEVTRSDGRLLPVQTNQLAADWTREPNANTHGAMRLQLRTDANGEAEVWWTLGSEAGCANNRVCVTGTGISNKVFLCASAQPHPARQLNLGSGNNQRVEAGGITPEPLRVWASDGLNPAVGIPITFRVVQGGGRIIPGGRDGSPIPVAVGNADAGAAERVIVTGVTGHASAGFIAGPEGGPNRVEASFPGQFGLPVTFVIEGLIRRADQAGSFAGLVLDNTKCPIGGAVVRLQVANVDLSTTSDSQGRFRFENVQGGMGHLYVNGATANQLLGKAIPTNSFPALTYSITTVANAENALPTPVLLPRLNPANARVYNGTEDITLTCEGIEGLKFTIQANSMRHPDGTRVTPDRPAVVSLNQVHHDDIPMPMPDGVAPPFAWTFQPGGAHFDAERPVKVEYPNMSGLAPGSIAYFLSFNHDTERFEIAASGHVTDDGATILTDPGSGLTISGWGCNCPPYSVTGNVRNTCKVAVAVFSGGLAIQAGNPDVPNPRIREIVNRLHSKFPGEVFSRIIATANFAQTQITEASQWLNALDSPDSPDPKRMLIGYSAGGSSVWISCFRNLLRSDSAITIDPVSRALAAAGLIYRWADLIGIPFTCGSYLYQRGCRFPGNGITVNILADDSSDREACKTSLFLNDYDCIRGFEIDGARRELLIGKDHFSVLESEQTYDIIESELAKLVRPNERSLAKSNEIVPARALGFLESGTIISVVGQSSKTPGDGSLELFNVSVPDSFGPSGPGSTPDFVGDDFVRVIGVSTQGEKNRYAFSEFFRIKQGETTFINDLTFTDQPPRKPERLEILSPSRTLRIGTTNQLQVIAHYADGTTNDVSAKTAWTSYRSSNPKLATITPDGEILLISPGGLHVTAMNEGTAAVGAINVVREIDPLLTIYGIVLNSDSTPASDVRITVDTGAGFETKSDSTGAFRILGVPTTLGEISINAQRIVSRHLHFASARIGKSPGGEMILDPLRLQPLSPSKQVVGVGEAHMALVRPDGSLWAWGRNRSGQIGNGTISDQPVPVRVGTNVIWKVVSAGREHTVAVAQDGTLWAWGYNRRGQLGDGTVKDRSVPVEVVSQLKWASAKAADDHTLALASDGTLWGWGENSQGQIGDGSIVDRIVPTRSGTNSNWRTIDTGFGHSLAVTVEGKLWAWGANVAGEIGDGTAIRRNSPVEVGIGRKWLDVVAGDNYSMGLTSDGTLWTWGANTHGQLGDGSFRRRLVPVQVGTNQAWMRIASGHFTSMGLSVEGNVWGWGQNENDLRGDGDRTDVSVPVLVGVFPSWEEIDLGPQSGIAASGSGVAWTWGAPSIEVGEPERLVRNYPLRIMTNSVWLAASAGRDRTLALSRDGRLRQWGINLTGMPEDANRPIRQLPGEVLDRGGWVDVGAGAYHMVAIHGDGSMWSWGGGFSGALGDGLTADRQFPGSIATNRLWATVSVHGATSLALTRSGELWGWGNNAYGQLGDGTRLDRPLPVSISSNTIWRSVSTGFHSAAIDSEGRLWAWGAGGSGQLGDGSATSQLSPLRIGDLTNWTDVSVGGEHSMGVRSDGSLWCWGNNFDGQIGNGTRDRAHSPVRVAPDKRWKRVFAGEFSSFAVAEDGSAWAWGSNETGILGVAGQGPFRLPIRINLVPEVIALSSGRSHTMAICRDGSLWAWGANYDGQLGDFRPAYIPSRLDLPDVPTVESNRE